MGMGLFIFKASFPAPEFFLRQSCPKLNWTDQNKNHMMTAGLAGMEWRGQTRKAKAVQIR